MKPTALLGDYPRERIAVIAYGAVMLFAGISFSWMRFYAFFVAKLARDEIERSLLKEAIIKSACNPLLHLVAILIAFFHSNLAIGHFII
jgi:hypothetical protein